MRLISSWKSLVNLSVVILLYYRHIEMYFGKYLQFPNWFLRNILSDDNHDERNINRITLLQVPSNNNIYMQLFWWPLNITIKSVFYYIKVHEIHPKIQLLLSNRKSNRPLNVNFDIIRLNCILYKFICRGYCCIYKYADAIFPRTEIRVTKYIVIYFRGIRSFLIHPFCFYFFLICNCHLSVPLEVGRFFQYEWKVRKERFQK